MAAPIFEFLGALLNMQHPRHKANYLHLRNLTIGSRPVGLLIDYYKTP